MIGASRTSVRRLTSFHRALLYYCRPGQRSLAIRHSSHDRLLCHRIHHRYGDVWRSSPCSRRVTLRSQHGYPQDDDGQKTCSGCGSVLQYQDPQKRGYIPPEKLQCVAGTLGGSGRAEGEERGLTDGSADGGEVVDVTEGDGVERSTQLICKRCFSLKHYNTALNVTLQEDDYLRHLSHLREKRALLLLVVDVIDFPGSLFPNLHTLASPSSRVLVVANKIDLLPKNVDENFYNRLEALILDECKTSSLEGYPVAGVVFTSVKSGEGLESLTDFILESWGNRGDVYLLGCTNVGKSSLFNYLLQSLCGASPGQLDVAGGPPVATISHWPGTTLGVLSFPIMSMGKRRRLLAQQLRAREAMDVVKGTGRVWPVLNTEIERSQPESGVAQNRFWLHDTPGAINKAQIINLLTTKELNLSLPKKPLKPRTFILRPGQCLLLGGLARLDYHDGLVSGYFTVFSASYLPVHVTRVDKADTVRTNNLGTPLLKIPFGDAERLAGFPEFRPQLLSVTGTGWNSSAADIVLSSAGWVGITVAQGKEVHLMAHTPGGRGIHCRQPSLWPAAVTKRGKRSQNRSNRATFTG